MSLNGGTLRDSQGRTGYIASNYQFQFDDPPQAGALATDGFSMCSGRLALAGSTTFYRCLSGTFYNLYSQSWAPQCEPVTIVPVPCDAGPSTGDGGSGGGGGSVPPGTTLVPTTLVTVLSDGQPQVVSTEVPLCQIGDGQVQGQTGPCASAPRPPAPSASPAVCQIGDGQVQGQTGPCESAPPAPEASPSPEVCQIGDGQVQGQTGPCAPPATAPTPAPAPTPAAGAQPQLCEIWGDGHIRAPPPAGAQYQGSWGSSDQGFGGGSPGGGSPGGW